MYIATYDSPIGTLSLVATQTDLVGLYLPDARHIGVSGLQGAGFNASPVFARAFGQLDRYFAGDLPAFDLPLAATGTPFQMRVWDTLKTIPHGETTTYGDIARKIGQPSAARAVGIANSLNPISIIVPCHRVIGANGKLTGYSGGLAAKEKLLTLERSNGALSLL